MNTQLPRTNALNLLKSNFQALTVAAAEELEAAKRQGAAQLEQTFPKTTTNPQACCSRGVNVEIGGKSYFVKGTPTYIHNINEGTYSLQSIEYTVTLNKPGQKEGLDGSDYLNNIIENKAISSNSNVQDLQKELNELMDKIKNKTEQLRKLIDKISGNGDSFSGISFDPVNPDSPDAAETLSRQIQAANAELTSLDQKIKEKTNEYVTKTETLSRAKNESNELKAEYNTKIQLYDDLCEHYGVENNIELMTMSNPEKQDLDSLIDFYKKYTEMQKENIKKLDNAIKNTKGQAKTEETKYPIVGTGEKELEQLNEKVKKALKLLNDLCQYYGIENKLTLQELPTMITTGKHIQSPSAYYGDCMHVQKENLQKIYDEIDRLQGNTSAEVHKPGPEELEKLKNLINNKKSFFFRD